MIPNSNKLQAIINRAEADNDLETLDSLLSEGFERTETSPRPFSAAMAMKDDFRNTYFSGEPEGGAAVNWLNRIARAQRRVTFNIKTMGGFEGLILAEEGDSWTQYPVLLDDIVDQLNQKNHIAVYSTGAAGDIIENMAREKEYLQALQATGAPGMILSGGGNDLLGDGALEQILLPFGSGKPPQELVNHQKLKQSISRVLGHYRTILSDTTAAFPAVKVFGHGYDLPYPEAGGKWLGGPLAAQGIPLDVGRDVIKLIIDDFNNALAKLAQISGNFVYTDLRGVVDRGPISWFDELHPKNAGYERAANAILDAIEANISSRIERFTAAGVESFSGFESGAAANKVIVLDPGHGGNPPPAKLGGSRWNNAVGPNGTLEKQLTLDVAKRTKTILESRGFTVQLTRSTDVNSSLKARAGVAQRHRAAVFVSIHFNASEGHNAQGTETFVHTSNNAASRKLCVSVQSEMVAALGLRDRNSYHPGGIKKYGYGVLKPVYHSNLTAAILHEVSFLDRTAEEQKLQAVSYRQKIATALANGIDSYLGDAINTHESFISSDEIGDAIEAAALESGRSTGDSPFGVQSLYEGVERSDEADVFNRSFSGGHLISNSDDGAGKPEYGAGGDGWLRDMAESLAQRHAAPRTHENFDRENDVNEFKETGIGPALDFSIFGHDAEKNASELRQVFGGVERTSFDYNAFASFIRGLNLRHFGPEEFLFLGGQNSSGRCAATNSLPPQSLWSNLARSARMLDEIRHQLGAPVRILSCYRSPAYNTCIGGESGSLHMRFNAIDWYCTKGRPGAWSAVAKSVRASNADYRGGIGLYTRSNFIHIDTRGREANWGS